MPPEPRNSEADRYLGKIVGSDMISVYPSLKDILGDSDDDFHRRKTLMKSPVKSPYRMMEFLPSKPSSLTTARRDLFGSGDLARDASMSEKAVINAVRKPALGEKSFGSTEYDSVRPNKSQRPFSDSRITSRKPYQILRLPNIKDDYYQSILDWSISNIIVVSLRDGIFTYNGDTTQTVALTNPKEAQKEPVQSLAWGKGDYNSLLAEGLVSGSLRVRDTGKNKIIYTVEDCHSPCHRIGSCSWHPKSALIATGSKDKTIAITDIRTKEPVMYAFGHEQEVCGVKWDLDGTLLASGGNDNQLIVWDSRALSRPLVQFREHKAAIKAIAWSPHRRGRLVSGGGTADKHLRFWDTKTLSCIGKIDTGSQVCNVAWSANIDEIVSTHGFSQNQIVVWDTSYSTSSSVPVSRPATPLATLRGHKSRVLHLAVSPDGRSIATAAGDQTLRFWNVFPSMYASMRSSLDETEKIVKSFYSSDPLAVTSYPEDSFLLPEGVTQCR